MNLQHLLRRTFCPAAFTSFLLAVLLIAGCGESKQATAPNPLTRDQSPQAKYDRMMESLRKSLEPDVLAGGGRFTMQNAAGSGTTITKYAIDAPTVIAPPVDGQPQRATIKITQSSSYSFMPAASDKASEDNEGPDAREQGDPLVGPLGDTQATLDSMGVEVLDPASVNKNIQDESMQRIGASAIASRTINADAQVQYELIYENDRWRLAKPPASDAMEATNIAVQTALKRQR